MYNYTPPSQQPQSIKQIVWFIFHSTNYVIIHNIKSVPPDLVYHRFPETFICLLLFKRTLNYQSYVKAPTWELDKVPLQKKKKIWVLIPGD